MLGVGTGYVARCARSASFHGRRVCCARLRHALWRGVTCSTDVPAAFCFVHFTDTDTGLLPQAGSFGGPVRLQLIVMRCRCDPMSTHASIACCCCGTGTGVLLEWIPRLLWWSMQMIWWQPSRVTSACAVMSPSSPAVSSCFPSQTNLMLSCLGSLFTGCVTRHASHTAASRLWRLERSSFGSVV